MKDEVGFTLRVSRRLLSRFGYVAKFNGRTKNKELEQIMKHHIAEFEREHGPIKQEDLDGSTEEQ